MWPCISASALSRWIQTRAPGVGCPRGPTSQVTGDHLGLRLKWKKEKKHLCNWLKPQLWTGLSSKGARRPPWLSWAFINRAVSPVTHTVFPSFLRSWSFNLGRKLDETKFRRLVRKGINKPPLEMLSGSWLRKTSLLLSHGYTGRRGHKGNKTSPVPLFFHVLEMTVCDL